MTSMRAEMLQRISHDAGFIAALDQSGGSTPKALALYGIDQSDYQNEAEMFDLVHQMRCRIINNPAFTGKRILGAILFEDTLDRCIDGEPSAQYLWQRKRVLPFLKIDKGLAEPQHGVQLMKKIPELDALLDKALAQQVFGTKMRSLITQADENGIEAVVTQQFALARHIVAKGLLPIIEPEVDINSPDKAQAEQLLRQSLLRQLSLLPSADKVMLKLSLPEQHDFYRPCIEHPNVLKVVALSGGYSRQDAVAKLAENHGMIASFSRALTEGLSQQQSEEQFTQQLDKAIEAIFQASCT